MVRCLNKTDKLMEERKNYMETTGEICQDLRLEDLNKYKEIIKR